MRLGRSLRSRSVPKNTGTRSQSVDDDASAPTGGGVGTTAGDVGPFGDTDRVVGPGWWRGFRSCGRPSCALFGRGNAARRWPGRRGRWGAAGGGGGGDDATGGSGGGGEDAIGGSGGGGGAAAGGGGAGGGISFFMAYVFFGRTWTAAAMVLQSSSAPERRGAVPPSNAARVWGVVGPSHAARAWPRAAAPCP